jgi:hypothetical protein
VTDVLLPVRKALLTAMKQSPGITDLVPAIRIYPQAAPVPVPAWPFIQYGAPTSIPLRAACVKGGDVTVAVHSFAKPRVQGTQVVETAEDYAARIGAAVTTALDGRKLEVPGGRLAVLFTNSQLLIDGGETTAFHHVANFRVRAFLS